MKCILYILAVLLIILSACSGSPKDSRLLDISKIVADKPEEALDALYSIDSEDLSESDRHFYDFLCIKAKDKAYITHTSDSLILDVINYYSKHKKKVVYPEALYYGGRVYRDLGDGPTALRYFQDAIDELNDTTDNDLRCRILSQTGGLFNSMRLYNEATNYLNQVVTLLQESSDSLSLMQNLQLLGAIYMHTQDYHKADSCFNKAFLISKDICHSDSLIINMYLAGTKLQEGKIEVALKKIRSVISNIHDNYKRHDIINAYTSQIYYKSAKYDTAYLYAKKLIHSPYNNYQKNGYSLLLSPELRQFSSSDSLLSYSLRYREVLDKFLNQHNAQQMLLQTSLYNYETQEREKIKSEKSKRYYMLIAGFSVTIILSLTVITLYFRNKSTRNLLQYHLALQDITLLRKSLDSLSKLEDEQNEIQQSSRSNDSEKITTSFNDTIDNLSDSENNEIEMARELLKAELLTLQKEGLAKKEVSESIKTSSVYEKIQDYVLNKKLITDIDPLWDELETTVLEESPKFKSRLYLLAGERLKKDAYHLALLIRCGFRPSELSILSGRTKGAISSRRGYLCSSIFGEKYGAAVMDDIILLL